MTTTSTTTQCPLCDGTHCEIRRDVAVRYTYLRKKHVLDGQEHTLCLDCGCSFFQDGQIERNNARFIAWSKGMVKDIAPWEIRELREKYDLSQEDACRVFNCGSKTQFSKWERGEVAPTGTASLTLREALSNPEFMNKLARQAGVKIHTEAEALPKPIAVASSSESWIAVYAAMARAHTRAAEARHIAAGEVAAWSGGGDRLAESSVHTNFLFFDPEATSQRPTSRIFSSTHGQLYDYAILQGAMIGGADEPANDWLRAPANVPLVGLARNPVKKAVKHVVTKGGGR